MRFRVFSRIPVVPIGICFVVILPLTHAVTASGAALINGDFEGGNTGFTTAYASMSQNTAEGQYTVNTNPTLFNPTALSFGDHTTGAGLMMLLNGSPSPNTVAWEEVIPVSANAIYEFSGWARSLGIENPATIEVVINGDPLGSTLNLPTGNGGWKQLDDVWRSNVSTSADIKLIDTNTALQGNDFALDDLSFSAVPEPSSLWLLGFIGTALLKRRQPQ